VRPVAIATACGSAGFALVLWILEAIDEPATSLIWGVGIAAALLLAISATAWALVLRAWIRGRAREARPEKSAPPTLDSVLADGIAEGQRLLEEAREPDTVATARRIDAFIEKVDGWIGRVADALLDNGERERADAWDHVVWHRGRPSPGDTDDADQRLYSPLLDKVRELERHRDEIAQASRVGADLTNDVQRELVAIIDEGNSEAVRGALPFGGRYGPVTIWTEHTVTFLEDVFGGTERQRFLQRYEPPDPSIHAVLADRLKRLADLRDRPETWRLQVDGEGFRQAVSKRRSFAPDERIVMAHRKAEE
jgi:hypothetical protein